MDLEAAIGFVVARGDEVDRARLAYLRTCVPAPRLARSCLKFLTTNAAFWLSAAGLVARPGGPIDRRVGGAYSGVVAGWLGAAVLFGQAKYLESARMRLVLGDRLAEPPPADVAWLACALRRLGLSGGDPLLVAARHRLGETQHTDGSWPSDDGDAFTVHTTLTAIRACRPAD